MMSLISLLCFCAEQSNDSREDKMRVAKYQVEVITLSSLTEERHFEISNITNLKLIKVIINL